MICPKCKSNIGIHFHERYLQSLSNARGISCFICGYWFNGEITDFKRSLRRK